MTATSGRPARLHPADLAALASTGLRTRTLRAGLSALGIAIGVAAIVAVLGLAASSRAALLAQIQALGTNLLTVSNGQTFSGDAAELPQAAPGMIARLPGVTAVQETGTLSGVSAYKSPLVPSIQTNALSVAATTLNLPAVAGTSLAQGRFLDAVTAHEPVAVLGAATAQLLGIDRILPGMRIWAGGTLFLGLGAVALLVGAIGVANIMIISVLERRSEIGLRRALGATRGQIRAQFLAEAILLSLVGGIVGGIVGAATTAVYAHAKGWAIVIPPDAWSGGLAAALLIGATAGLLPAIRAARLAPTQALWSI